MSSYTLSPREDEIVTLAIEGLTNEAIANQLNLSIGTVNTYWSRVRLKVGGVARTDTVAKVIADRSEERRSHRAAQPAHFPEMDCMSPDLRAALSLFLLATEDASSALWAIDKDMTICCIASVRTPLNNGKATWDVGRTIFQIFGSTDKRHPAIAAHRKALDGLETTVSLTGDFEGMQLRTVPLLDEEDKCIGCVGVLSSV